MFTDADHRLFSLAAKHDGVFTFADAIDCGLSRRQASYRATHVWTRMYRGVYVAPGVRLTTRGAMRAAAAAGAPHAAVSHRAAAALYRLPGGRSDLAEITCPRWLRSRQRGLVVHETSRVDPVDTQLIDALPVFRPEIVLVQLAGIHRSPDFIELVLHSMRRQRLATYESVASAFARKATRGRPGVRVLREVLARWDPALAHTDSDMETLLMQLLHRAGYQDARPQYELFDARGRFVARFDIGLPGSNVGVEYDSDQEHSDEMSRARDNRRNLRIMSLGWVVVPARKDDVQNGGHEFLAALRAQIRRQSASHIAT
jgi:putative AbiEi antitoxin of type IV toxin-antitoxin system